MSVFILALNLLQHIQYFQGFHPSFSHFYSLSPLSGAQAVLSSFAKPPFGVFHENLEIIFDKAGVCMSLGAGWSRDRGRGAA